MDDSIKFRNGIIKILNNYSNNDINMDILIANIPNEFELPIICTNGENPIEYLLKEFELMIRIFGFTYYGKIKDSFYWFPFLIYYSWHNYAKLCFINLEQNSGVKYCHFNSVKANNYSPIFESDIIFINNYFECFVVPNRIFQFNNDVIFEILNQMYITENSNDFLSINCNKDKYVIDKKNKIIKYNNTQLKKLNYFKNNLEGLDKNYDLDKVDTQFYLLRLFLFLKNEQININVNNLVESYLNL